MYDVKKLKTQEECRTVMQRAKEQNREDIYVDVFRHMCMLEGLVQDDPSDPLVRDFYETLAAYEQLLSEKNGRTTKASRTRQKIANKGVFQSLIDWTEAKDETEGFKLLVERGLHEYAGEYLVMKYSKRFPENIVEQASRRLAEHGIYPSFML